MGEFLLYMLKSGFCLVLFYFFYKGVMSRTTFFRLNRFLILSGIALCMVLPFVRITITNDNPFFYHIQQFENLFISPVNTLVEQPEVYDDIEPIYNKVEAVETETVHATIHTISLRHALFILYFLGAFCTFLVYLVSHHRMAQLIKSLPRRHYKDYQVILADNNIGPFSFGKYIILPRDNYSANSEILIHEAAHIRLHHTLDLIFIQFMLALQWFNPAIWLIKKELQDIHEYQADSETIKSGIDATEYQLLLVKKTVGTRLYSMANGFNHSKLKNRISMMLKEKTNKYATLRVLLLVPVMSAAVYLFAQQQKIETPVSAPIPEEVNIPVDLETYFKEEFAEYQKLAPVYDLKKGVKDSRTNYLFMNAENAMLFNNDLVYLETLAETVYDKILGKYSELKNKTGKPETQIINVMWDRGSDSQHVKEMLDNLMVVSEKLKNGIHVSANESDPNVRYPMVVNIAFTGYATEFDKTIK